MNLAIEIFNSYYFIIDIKPPKKLYEFIICACASIASCLCETFPPQTDDWIYITVNKFTIDEFKEEIANVTTILSGKLMIPCSINYLNIIYMLDDNFADLDHKTIQYVLELCYCIGHSHNYHPYKLTVAAIFYVRMSRNPIDNESLKLIPTTNGYMFNHLSMMSLINIVHTMTVSSYNGLAKYRKPKYSLVERIMDSFIPDPNFNVDNEDLIDRSIKKIISGKQILVDRSKSKKPLGKGAYERCIKLEWEHQ